MPVVPVSLVLLTQRLYYPYKIYSKDKKIDWPLNCKIEDQCQFSRREIMVGHIFVYFNFDSYRRIGCKPPYI